MSGLPKVSGLLWTGKGGFAGLREITGKIYSNSIKLL